MSLTRGRVLHRYSWTKMKITEDTIRKVTNMALAEGQGKIASNFKYTYTKDGEDIQVEHTEDEGEDYDKDLPLTITNVQETTTLLAEHEETEAMHEEPDNRDEDSLADREEQHQERDNENTDDDEGTPHERDRESKKEDLEEKHEHNRSEATNAEEDTERDINVIRETSIDPKETTNEEDETSEPNDIDEPEERRSGDMERRPRRRLDYRAFHNKGARQVAQKVKKTKRKLKRKYKIMVKDIFRKVMKITMSHINAASKHDQVSVEERIRRFGNKAIEAVLKEYTQLNDKSVFRPRFVNELTSKQKSEALNLITMVKQKRCGTIKGRACADGRKQRRYITKEQATSPTVHLESLLLSLLFDAFEGTTADIAGAFLLANMKDFVLVKIRGEAVDIICKCNQEYTKYVTYENGKKVLYLELVKALYGCMMSSLLWYETFVTQLEQMGFLLNPYDPCVANATIDGSQCTICWYVDDTKILHVKQEVVDKVINVLENRFGKMTVKRGDKHTFVRMDFQFKEEGKVEISMKEYLQECIETFEETGEVLAEKCSTPGKHDLFKIDKGSKLKNDKRAEIFHHIVAKLLYVSKRSRLDIDLVVSFMCTIVAEPSEQDWEKLRRLLIYVKGTIDLVRTISAEDLTTIRAWADASYAVHDDMRGHTGGVISFGIGVTHHKSHKQKLNAKSSTESEIIGASDYLPWLLWTKRFMQKQGYNVKTTKFFQDNESAMKLETNGLKSSSEKTRHIDIRYFFIKDISEQENITIEHCRTEKMIADFFTKPLQGSLFKKMRNIIMYTEKLPVEERVEVNNPNGKATDNIICANDISKDKRTKNNKDMHVEDKRLRRANNRSFKGRVRIVPIIPASE